MGITGSGRPLILGSYYVKELSRSEGFELSVNGLQQERTNYGAGLETPESVSAAGGTAVLAPAGAFGFHGRRGRRAERVMTS